MYAAGPLAVSRLFRQQLISSATADQLKLQAGFFELERGVNSLFIENQDCWVAEPDYRMEQDVMDGKYDGSMYGLVDAQKPQRMQPAMQVS